MPLSKARKALYPANWKHIVGQVRERSGDSCEWKGCGLANRAWIVRFPDGSADVLVGQPFDRDLYEVGGGRVVRVILTTAHLDHNPANCDLGNLRYWCQYHHLNYVAKHHSENAKKTRQAQELKRQPMLMEAHP